MDNKVNDVGYNIRLIRKSLNLTQEQFADKLGVTRSAVQHWEDNYRQPGIDMLRKMKEVYNISYEEIIDGV